MVAVLQLSTYRCLLSHQLLLDDCQVLSFDCLLPLVQILLGTGLLRHLSLSAREWGCGWVILAHGKTDRVREHSFTETLGLLLCQSTQHLDVLVGSNQFHGEVLDLPFELVDELGLRIVILNWFVLDLGGFGCIRQCHVVFLEVRVTWVDVGDHAAGRVASKTLSKKACQLAVSVGNVHHFPICASSLIPLC